MPRKPGIEYASAVYQAMSRGGVSRGCVLAGDDLAEVLLEKGLKRLSKRPEGLVRDRKLMSWKVAVASWSNEQCGVISRWFSKTICRGTIYSISRGEFSGVRYCFARPCGRGCRLAAKGIGVHGTPCGD